MTEELKDTVIRKKKGSGVRKWILRIFAVLAIVGGWWLAKLIWFKPLNIDHFYERVFIEFVLRDPELLSQLRILEQFGLDFHNDDLTDATDGHREKLLDMTEDNLAMLRSYDREAQSESQRLSTDILAWFLEDRVNGRPFSYHDYPVNQLFGVQSSLPEFMATIHQVTSRGEAEDYLARLSKFDTKFDQVLEGLKNREELGIVPPKFVIRKVLTEMRGFVDGGVRSNILYVSFDEKLSNLADLGDEEKAKFLTRAEEIVETIVFPSYGTLIDYFSGLESRATDEDGVWKLPNGEAYYNYQLRSNTTTDMTADEIHRLGLEEVARIEGEMRAILDGLGHVGGTVGEWMKTLTEDERFLYPNDAEGRRQCIEEYQRIIDHIDQNLAAAFDIRPEMGVEVKRIPEFKEKTSPGAYYNPPAMDGSRPGVFFANLRDMSEVPKFGMKTLSYHEATPGHHFQLAIQQELTGVPTFRKILPFTAYVEGWALYAERLAAELGFYEDDPYGDLGRLQAEIFRAVRLVVDTGIHRKRWTREQAIEYMENKTGMAHGDIVSEIERYIVIPGQACAYKVGQLKILELRERAKLALGDRFDLRQFHNVMLKNGSLPLTILERLVDAWIAGAGGA